MKEQLIVDSAESFLLAINKMRADTEVLPPKFQGWPNFYVQIEGDRYKGTMTPKLMAGFIEFHEQLLRAYAEIRYDSPILTRLTGPEKAELDLVFEISKGCTEGRGSLDEIINKLVSALPMNKMTGTQVTTLLIVVVLSFGGYHVFKDWSAASLEKARLEARHNSDEANGKIIDQLVGVIASQGMTKDAERVLERAEEGYRSIVEGAPDATSMNIQAEHYNADELDKIRAQEPKSRTRAERRENVLIEMVKRSQGHLSLTLRLPGDEYTFPGKVELSTFDPAKLDELFDAIKHAKPVRLFHYSVMENGRILKTTVLAVDDVTK